MRKAFILLVIVALVILGLGALNNGTALKVDYVAGTANAVSLLWVSGLLAVLVLVVGMAAAWFAQSAMKGSRRKLEAELQSTYERLRESEALATRRATEAAAATAEATQAKEAAAATAAATQAAEDAAATVVEPESATVVAGEEATAVVAEDMTVVSDAAAAANDEEVTVLADEAATEVAPGEADTVAGTDAAEETDTGVESPAVGAGEQTAITMAGAADDAAADAPADAEASAVEPAADDTGAGGPASS